MTLSRIWYRIVFVFGSMGAMSITRELVKVELNSISLLYFLGLSIDVRHDLSFQILIMLFRLSDEFLLEWSCD